MAELFVHSCNLWHVVSWKICTPLVIERQFHNSTCRQANTQKLLGCALVDQRSITFRVDLIDRAVGFIYWVMYFFSYTRVEVCSLLLAHGADPTLLNCHSKAAVDAAPTRELQDKLSCMIISCILKKKKFYSSPV